MKKLYIPQGHKFRLHPEGHKSRRAAQLSYIIPVALLLLAGCSGAPHVDKEFGMANRQAFEMQIAYQDYRHADQTPEGMTGIVAEEIMDVYTDDFGKAPEEVDIFQLGIEQD
ncbi:MAG: hypothetical protein RQ753_06290 [Desulfurivibrionaceae bacterium]|nr:hypothetical protein [Desulfobulbales bacterium]MDT8335286.1 hypothetical protein [Desulfurivibrionaceae bacterium]